jgi:hypothetical protein
MNEFGVPMTEADINMSANPAKAMLEQQLDTSGRVNKWILPAIGIGASLWGASKSSSAANKATDDDDLLAPQRLAPIPIAGKIHLLTLPDVSSCCSSIALAGLADILISASVIGTPNSFMLCPPVKSR